MSLPSNPPIPVCVPVDQYNTGHAYYKSVHDGLHGAPGENAPLQQHVVKGYKQNVDPALMEELLVSTDFVWVWIHKLHHV
ncbi:thrombospondin-1 [Biomphalaria glabrata]|nr:thrombospondin-1 [Biomphalaria glabrata]